MNKRKVLIITYAWPPAEGVGLARVLKFTKYLPDYGWIPVILTIKSGSDDKLDHLPPQSKDIKVYRSNYRDVIEGFRRKFHIRQKSFSRIYKLKSFFRELLTIPDAQIGWYKPAIFSGERILNEEKIDLIFSTSPPETAHLIARHLKKSFNIPWLADLRDPWANNHFRSGNFVLKEMILRFMEKDVLKSSDGVITVSEPWASNLRSSTGIAAQKVKVIENGFDDEDFSAAHPRNEKFTVVYTGKLHKEHQPINNFFKVLKELVMENRVDLNRINIKFYVFGYDRPDIRRLTELYGLDGAVRELERVDNLESIRIQMSSDVLLFIKWQGRGGEGVYTTKIYDYIGARRPILVMGPKVEIIDDLIKRTSSGIIACDEYDLREAIANLYDEFIKKGNVEYKGNEQEILKCTRRLRTEKLADVFDLTMDSKL